MPNQRLAVFKLNGAFVHSALSKLYKTGLLSALIVSACWVLPTSDHARAQSRDPIVVLETTKGPIFIRIFSGLAPHTARNFLDLVNRGFYNGLSFHRVEDWVIQGGDPNGNGTGVYVDPTSGRPRYLPLEANYRLSHNAAGVVAMAHGPSPNSNSCQFYIIKRPKPELDGNYSIFGGVVKGMNVVYSITRGDQILSAQIINNNADGIGNTRVEPSYGSEQPSVDSGF